MTDIGTQVDSLGFFLTGGANNDDPDASLGGVVSSSRVIGLGPLISSPVPSVRVDHVYPAVAKGDAEMSVDSNGDLVFTPPGGTAGTPVTIAAGESKVITGADANKAMVVFREAGLNFSGVGKLSLLGVLNGTLAMANVTDAQRVAGVTTYRGVMFMAQGLHGVTDIRLWLPPVAGAQGVFSIGVEAAVGDSIQIIPDETTAPVAVVFSTPTTEGAALVIPGVSAGACVGLWIRRVFPAAGTVDPQEDFQLAMKYIGAT